MASEKWFKGTAVTGWRKTQNAQTRRRKLYASTDRRKSVRNRLLEAARRIQALANVTNDKATKIKAGQDAKHFFKLARGAEK